MEVYPEKMDGTPYHANDVANDVIPVWWMEVYPFRFNQSKSLLQAGIKWLAYTSTSLYNAYNVYILSLHIGHTLMT